MAEDPVPVPLLEVGSDGAFDLDAMPAEPAAPPPPPAASSSKGGGCTAPEKTFDSCKTFSGHREGWVFKNGGRGIGYYRDHGPAQQHLSAAAVSSYYHFASTGERHKSKWDTFDVEAEMAKVDVDSASEDSADDGEEGCGDVSRSSFGAKQAKARAAAKAAKLKAEAAVRREREVEHAKRSSLEQARIDATCPGRAPEQVEMIAQVMMLSDGAVAGMAPAQRAQVEPIRAMERRRLAALREALAVPGRTREQAQAIAQCLCLTEEQIAEMPEAQQEMINSTRANERRRKERGGGGGGGAGGAALTLEEQRERAKCEGRSEEQVDAIARVMMMTDEQVSALDSAQRQQVEQMRSMEGQRQAAEDALAKPGQPQKKLTPEEQAAKAAKAAAEQWEKYVGGMKYASGDSMRFPESKHDGKARSPAEQAAQLAATSGISKAVALEATTGRAATEPAQRPDSTPATQKGSAHANLTMQRIETKLKKRTKKKDGKAAKKAQMAAFRKMTAKPSALGELGGL